MLERQTGSSYVRLQSKLDEFPSNEITTTIVTFEEQMRGWMSHLAKMRSIDNQVFLMKRSNNISIDWTYQDPDKDSDDDNGNF